MGIYSLPGVAIVCLIVPCQYFFGWFIIRNKVRNGPNIQERSAVIQEILPAMKLVKYYAWERFFEKRVSILCAYINSISLLLCCGDGLLSYVNA